MTVHTLGKYKNSNRFRKHVKIMRSLKMMNN